MPEPSKKTEVFTELDDQLYRQVVQYTDAGNMYFEQTQYKDAFEQYQKAMKLIPKPIEQWEASTWILAALGDCLFMAKKFKEALPYFRHTMLCTDGLGTPFLHLRLGEIQLELGNEKRAKDELARAYMGGGKKIFKLENPKYFDFIQKYMDGI